MTPRILLWDLETSHNIVATFRLDNEDYIPHRNILKERQIICAAWKWLGEAKVHTASTLGSDKALVKQVYKVMLQADAIVAHNGQQYDEKFLNARIIFHGLDPLPPVLSLDTLKIARQKFYFNSNRLDYLGQYLGVRHKRDTETDLWLKVMRGDKRALKQMLAYNVQDVELLERVFLRLKPYMPNYVNRQLYGLDQGVEVSCPECGSTHSQAGPNHVSTTRAYKRYRCMKCRRWYRVNKALKAPRTMTRAL